VLVDAVLIGRSSAKVAPWVLALAPAAVTGCFALGLAYRVSGRSLGIGLAFVGSGLFLLIFGAVGTLNYLVVPYLGERIDPQLIALDRKLGFDWLRFVTWMSHHKLTSTLLMPVYSSSLFQMIILLLLLGFTKRQDAMHRFLLTGLFGAAGTILIWMVIPSSGPSAFVFLPAEVTARIPLVVDSNYGAVLNEFMKNGPSRLPPVEQLGVVGFPSFHTVMALMAIVYVPRDSWWRWPFWLINIAMFPAIVLHGGHHLVDVLGGVALFGLAWLATQKTMAWLSRRAEQGR
jgi:membrane-associated phospholipid phosphatase